MGRIRDELETDDAGLARRLAPRDDALVHEAAAGATGDGSAPTGPGRREFTCDHGPFRTYRRAVEWRSAGPGRWSVTQEVDWHLAIPYWAALYRPMVRRALRDGVATGRRPWWATPDRLSARQSTVLGTLCLFNLLAGLLYGVLTQVMTYVSADLGDGSASQQTLVLSLSRIGVVVTVAAMVLADRVGRRRIVLWSFGLSAALTVATALSPTLWVLAGLQTVSRNLAIAGLLAVDTISVEELPAGSRASAASLGTLAYGLGAGMVILALPLTDLGPGGWRVVFALSLLTVPAMWSASRHLPESARFDRLRHEGGTGEARRIRGGRFVLLAAVFFLLNVFIAPASQLQNDYLRTDRDFSGALISLFLVATNTPGGLGVLLGGHWAESRGRRAAIIPGLVAVGVFSALMFSTAGPTMWAASLLSSVLGGLCVAGLGVLAPELFPTSRRGGVRGVLTAIAVAGSVTGLLAAGQLVDARGYGPTFVMLAVAPLLAAVIVVAVPETRGRELEDLNRPTPSERR